MVLNFVEWFRMWPRCGVHRRNLIDFDAGKPSLQRPSSVRATEFDSASAAELNLECLETFAWVRRSQIREM